MRRSVAIGVCWERLVHWRWEGETACRWATGQGWEAAVHWHSACWVLL